MVSFSELCSGRNYNNGRHCNGRIYQSTAYRNDRCIFTCDFEDKEDGRYYRFVIPAKGEIDRVEMIYHHFKSAGSQILTRKTIMPIDIESELKRDHERDLTTNIVTRQAVEYLQQKGQQTRETDISAKPLNDNFIVEPDMRTVLSKLIPKYAHLIIYTALLDSNASEHAARMVAMQTATDNADELLRELNLQYNKSRQQAITNELLDIVGGSVNN